eukprot:TRINITY_DN93869_c0_g1_i1.p1 TRINITY_DN93869_c0_g1~~TRINITY_DN93869_c0_g1_i1.p1  ORF type:complete len:754 (-),score=110.67 TRINITY_DN93869_c0_g1_i1:284-2545(-)
MAPFMRTRVTQASDSKARTVPHIDLGVHYTFDVSEYTPAEPELAFGAEEIVAATNACWNKTNTETAYQPAYVDCSCWSSLSQAEQELMRVFSNLCRFGVWHMSDHSVRRRVLELEARASSGVSVASVVTRLVRELVRDCAAKKGTDDFVQKARALNDMYIAIGWLEKYYLFQDYDLFGDCHTSRRPGHDSEGAKGTVAAEIGVYLPKNTIARPYCLLARIFGNHEEFTYYNHYVGASCANMEEMRRWMREQVDFDDPESIKRWVLRFESLYDFQLPEHADSTEFGRTGISPKAPADYELWPSDYDLWPANGARSSRAAEGFPDVSEFLISERYFRFVHLAMEMVWSDKIDEICKLLCTGVSLSSSSGSSSDEAKAPIAQALQLLLEVERRMNLTFKSLPRGSKPSHYNKYVRPYIAGTWGRNCGSVYDARGKFFEGCGDTLVTFAPGTEEGNDVQEIRGKWKKHVGQTGAGTTVRPIGDEFAGGVSEVYTHPLPHYFTLALMRDQQVKVEHLCSEAVLEPGQRQALDADMVLAEDVDGRLQSDDHGRGGAATLEPDVAGEVAQRRAAPAVSPLTLMLTMFRAVTRPYTHNLQIQSGKTLMSSVQELIDSRFPELKLEQLRLQLACLTHRLDHYYYIQFYINDFGASGKQLRTAATGGSNTTDFLPDLIDSNMAQARNLVNFFKSNEAGAPVMRLVSEIEDRLDEFAAGKAKIRQNSEVIQSQEQAVAKVCDDHRLSCCDVYGNASGYTVQTVA